MTTVSGCALIEPDRPRAYIVSGSSGAGKSTLSRALAARFPRAACIDGDLITSLIVSGACPPRIESWSADTHRFDEETDRRLELRFRVIGRIARTYLDSGFSVIIDSFFAEPWIAAWLQELQPWEVHLISIQASQRLRHQRIHDRGTEPPVAGFDRLVDDALAGQPRTRGLWLDADAMRIEEAIDFILTSARVLPSGQSAESARTQRRRTASASRRAAEPAGGRPQGDPLADAWDVTLAADDGGRVTVGFFVDAPR